MIGKLIVVLYASIIMFMVSAIGALPTLFWGLSWQNYLAAFVIITAVQMFIGKLWNYFIDRRENARIEEAIAQQQLADSVQHAECICTYCGTANLARILIGEANNKFTCEACKETNSVIIDITCARVTNPIMPKAETAEIFKNIDKK